MLNLAAELHGPGVTANVYRPGAVDTAVQRLVRTEGGGRVDQEAHASFLRNYERGAVITADRSVRALVGRLDGSGSGEIWDVADPG